MLWIDVIVDWCGSHVFTYVVIVCVLMCVCMCLHMYMCDESM